MEQLSEQISAWLLLAIYLIFPAIFGAIPIWLIKITIGVVNSELATNLTKKFLAQNIFLIWLELTLVGLPFYFYVVKPLDDVF